MLAANAVTSNTTVYEDQDVEYRTVPVPSSLLWQMSAGKNRDIWKKLPGEKNLLFSQTSPLNPLQHKATQKT